MDVMERKEEKTLQDLLEMDPSLMTPVTVEEFLSGKANPQNTDWTIEEAFEAYREVMNIAD